MRGESLSCADQVGSNGLRRERRGERGRQRAAGKGSGPVCALPPESIPRLFPGSNQTRSIGEQSRQRTLILNSDSHSAPLPAVLPPPITPLFEPYQIVRSITPDRQPIRQGTQHKLNQEIKARNKRKTTTQTTRRHTTQTTRTNKPRNREEQTHETNTRKHPEKTTRKNKRAQRTKHYQTRKPDSNKNPKNWVGSGLSECFSGFRVCSFRFPGKFSRLARA